MLTKSVLANSHAYILVEIEERIEAFTKDVSEWLDTNPHSTLQSLYIANELEKVIQDLGMIRAELLRRQKLN